YTWSTIGGSLPAGLSLTTGGTISGTPTTAGTPNFTVQVQDNGSQTNSKALSITINPGPLTILTNSPLPNGKANTAYTQQALTAPGGPPDYSWSLASGSPQLPAGLTLTPGGVISGTPTTATTVTVNVQVQDSTPQTITKSLTITVDPPSLPLTAGL